MEALLFTWTKGIWDRYSLMVTLGDVGWGRCVLTGSQIQAVQFNKDLHKHQNASMSEWYVHVHQCISMLGWMLGCTYMLLKWYVFTMYCKYCITLIKITYNLKRVLLQGSLQKDSKARCISIKFSISMLLPGLKNPHTHTHTHTHTQLPINTVSNMPLTSNSTLLFPLSSLVSQATSI